MAKGITDYVRINLDRVLLETTNLARSYCACLSVHPDDSSQWRDYAEQGSGLAIGFRFSLLLDQQKHNASAGLPHLVYAPVSYDSSLQRDLVPRLVSAGIEDLQRFAETCSRDTKKFTSLRDRITKEIVVHLFCLIDFLKAPKLRSEGEMRIVLEPNNGTFLAPSISYYERNQQRIPYIFLDLLNPATGRLSLVDIKVGPSATFVTELKYAEELLDELGYGTGDYRDRPSITHSKLSNT